MLFDFDFEGIYQKLLKLFAQEIHVPFSVSVIVVNYTGLA
jgi:hypothetical protein